MSAASPHPWQKACRLVTAPLRMLPDFIIPGEAKCGTTSFYRCLASHPDILAADVKEPNNFLLYGASPNLCRMHYPLALARLAHRAATSRPCLTGEASPNYLASPAVPAAVAALCPRVKLIVLLRNPVLRAYSDYQMMKAGGFEDLDFEEGVVRFLKWIRDPRMRPLVALAEQAGEGFVRYILRGVYATGIRRWQEHVPASRFLFVQSERFFAEPRETMDRVFAFLGVAPFAVTEAPALKKGSYAGALSPRARQLLQEFYAPFNRELYALVGADYGWERDSEAGPAA